MDMENFPEAYADQLRVEYGDDIAGQFVNPANREAIPLEAQPGQTVSLLEVQSDVSAPGERKLFFVPGFGEDVINKASFAAGLALEGVELSMPGQNRKGVLKNEAGKRDATYTQARNYLTALEAAAGDEPVNIVTHSYGSLVLDEMIRQDPERFKGVNVVMLAPSGSIEDQGLLSLGMQWLRMLRSEMDPKRRMEFPDKKGYTGRASLRTLLKNPMRTFLEVKDLHKRKVDYARIAKAVGSLTVLTYGRDAMYPEDEMSPTLTAAVEAGYTAWATPVALDKVLSGEMTRGDDGAVHDDEQYNPSRVARAVRQILGYPKPPEQS